MSSRGDVYPEFFTVRQRITPQALADVAAVTTAELERAGIAGHIRPGQRVAIGVGSRGISNLREIVRATVQWVLDSGAEPVVVPAMGSHGGATAEGQTGLLASLGIDSSLGCRIAASMETVPLGISAHGMEIHFDRIASEADHILVINRIKPHTRLTGRWESGLIKMLMIGLGKHRGAVSYHQLFDRQGYQLDLIAPEIVGKILAQLPVRLGLAIVEDAFENTSLIEAVQPAQFLSREPELLALAKSRMLGLPFADADLLIVDRIGKEISGTGMDTNVIGRKRHDKFIDPSETPAIRQIYVRALTDKTAGNASGIGIAEYCHRQVAQAMDHEVTRINCVTAGHVTAGALPLVFPCDREVFDAVIAQVGWDTVAAARWLWITDTLHVDVVRCSAAYLDEATARADLEILDPPRPLRFDAAGDVIAAC